MTKSTPNQSIVPRRFAPGSSRGARSTATLLRQMAEEAERRSEIAARIRELRGEIPQPRIADRVGVSLRAYQEWEAGGGIKWDNYARLAEALGVSEEFIVYGEHGRSGPSTQLDRIEETLALMMGRLDRIEAAVATEFGAESLERELGAGGRPPKRHDDDTESDDPEDQVGGSGS